MENIKRIMVLIIVTTLVAGMIQAAEQPQSKLSKTRMASCVVKVTCDPAVLPLSFQTVRELMHSSAVFGKAARDVMGLPLEDCLGLFDIQALPDLIGTQTNFKDIIESTTVSRQDNYNMMEEGLETGTTTYTAKPDSASSRTYGVRSRRPSASATSFSSDIEQMLLFLLEVDFRQVGMEREVKPVAEEFMDALLQNLRSALTVTFEEHVQRLKDRLKLADEEVARVEQELNTKQRDLLRNFGSRILDRTKILADIENIRKDIQKVEVEQAADQADINETTKQIAKIKDGMQKEADQDTVISELTTLLQLQQLNVANMKKLSDSGDVIIAGFSDAMEKLTRIKIELAQRREQLSKSAGGNLIESLNSALVNCSIKTTQNQAKLKSLEQQLADARLLLNKTDAYELLSLKIDIDKQNLRETILWRDRMSRQVRIIQPPLVSIIGGD
jgi:hypothetical protein